MKRTIILALVVVIVLSSFTCIVSAAELAHYQSEESYSTYSFFFPSLYDANGNQYGYTKWGSLDAAKSYYGTDLVYKPCHHIFNGTVYNYFYFFSDLTKMFFGVIGK